MTDHRFEQLMKDAAATYRRPAEPPLEEMWKEIEAQAFGEESLAKDDDGARRGVRRIRWMQIAATLVIGVAIGRVSTQLRGTTPQPVVPAVVAAAPTDSTPRVRTARLPAAYQDATNQYLGETAALLVALPSEVKAGRSTQFVQRAGELLTTTRVLLDSPAARDPSMRALLEDLELVLAQVVRLQADRAHKNMDFINQALQQRDVIPRLRTAVADISAN